MSEIAFYLFESAIIFLNLFYLFEFELYVFEFGLSIFEFGVYLFEVGLQPFEFGLHLYEFAPKKVYILVAPRLLVYWCCRA